MVVDREMTDSFGFVVVNADLRQAITQRVAREAEQARSLRLVAAGTLQSFAIFRLPTDRASCRREGSGRTKRCCDGCARGRVVIGDFQLAARGERGRRVR